MKNKIIYKFLAWLTGMFLIFIGLRFIISPDTAAKSFGLTFQARGNYAFYYIKGIRDLFFGLLILTLAFTRQYKALATTLLLGTFIPMMDAWIVLFYQQMPFTVSIPHLSAIAVGLITGIGFLCTDKKRNPAARGEGIEIIQSIEKGGNDTAIEMDILPNASTPSHYHLKFSETIEVISGELFVTRDEIRCLLKEGESITIDKKELHSFKNTQADPCRVLVTINPGNREFEKAMKLYNGLAKEGMANKSGIPRKIIDLAVFLKMNDNHMKGILKIGEWFLSMINSVAEISGYARRLRSKYC